MKKYNPYLLVLAFIEEITKSLQRHIPQKLNIHTDVWQEFCNLTNKLSFSLWTGEASYTFSFSAYTIMYVHKSIKGEDTYTITPPHSLLEAMQTWLDILQEGIDEIYTKELEIRFEPVLLQEVKPPNIRRYELFFDNEPHEFIFSFAKEELETVSLDALDARYKIFNLPEVIRVNLARPILSDEQIDALHDKNNPENDILTPEEIDALLDYTDDVYLIEERPVLISRMLLYVMVAREKGLLGLLEYIEKEKDPLSKTLLNSAIDGKESAELLQIAKERMALLEFNENDGALYSKRIKIILKTIQLLHAAKGLKEAAAALEEL